MAGAWSSYCGRGCSSTSCACDQKGKKSDSSLLGRRLSEDSSRHQLLQKWTSMWSSAGWDASVAGAEKAPSEAEAAEAESPLVFLCSGCRRPLGDSLSWVAGQEDTNCILLRCQFRQGRAGPGWAGPGWAGGLGRPSQPCRTWAVRREGRGSSGSLWKSGLFALSYIL